MSKTSQLRQRAQTFLKKGNLPKVIEEYKKLLGAESRNPNLYNELGDIYLKANDRIQAVMSFEKAVTNYEKVALYNNAIAVCKKILRVVPSRGETIFKLGELKAKQKFTGEAVAYFIRFFQTAMSDEENPPGGLQEKAEKMLELVPDNDDIVDKAADMFSHVGMKLKSTELLTGLAQRLEERGDTEKAGFYRTRIENLKSSLTQAELKKIEQGATGEKQESVEKPDAGDTGLGRQASPEEIEPAVQQKAETGEAYPAGAKPEGTPSQTGEPEGLDDAGGKDGQSTEPEASGEGPAGTSLEKAPLPEHVSDEPAGKSETTATDESAEESKMIEAMDINGERPMTGQAPEDMEEESSPPPDGDSIQRDDRAEPSEASHNEPTDFASIIEESVDGDEGMDLASEITSDIEENDFKSHYDLGMAYLEMALYREAVKEYQIASRSEQLQLKSMEMIGYCFLQMNRPRLAVKQLERGLEIANSIGGDKLGIHYNLGLAYDQLGDTEMARENYEEVYIVDVTFRDIAEKMKKFSTIP